ncbi:hypothetical protein ACIO13_35055 [Streptomyces sp. NPDC087425]|uniref:hypothetical protein n=1 Tax=Streptomyces sp. NPDC087425 TaxID=3365787 RepID=UPI003809E284
MRQDVHDALRARLHETAGAHEPDRARILARIERGMAEQHDHDHHHRATRSPVWNWARVAGATAAVAGMLAAGGYAVASAVRSNPPQQQSVAVSPTPPAPSPDATSRAPEPPAASSPAAPTRPAAPHPSAPTMSPSAPAATDFSTGAAQDGPLRSDGVVDPHSNDFWAQSNLTLRTTEQLTSLTIELKVAQSGGVTSTGAWRSLPEQDFTQTTRESDGFVVYTWTLKADRTVPPGTWVFAGQYNHERGGRDARADAYTITGTADGGRRRVEGDFAASGS